MPEYYRRTLGRIRAVWALA